MWTFRFSASASVSAVFATLLLLSSTAGTLVHEHTSLTEQNSVDCVIDHENGMSIASSGLELHRAGERHHHECVGCQLTRQRSLVEGFRGGNVGLLADEYDAPKPTAPLRSAAPKRGPPLRGPPRV